MHILYRIDTVQSGIAFRLCRFVTLKLLSYGCVAFKLPFFFTNGEGSINFLVFMKEIKGAFFLEYPVGC